MKHVKAALAHLNPQEVRDLAERPVTIGLHADNELSYFQMETFFAPSQVSTGKRVELAGLIHRAGSTSDGASDIEVYAEDILRPRHGFSFSFHHPERTVRHILHGHPEFAIALARQVYPFRAPVVDAVIKKISRENAIFSLATALPDVFPLLSLPWAAGEFASDTAVLTANQIRMAFLIGGASDRAVGYREQRAEVASLIAGAFGWRAIARELVGMIPMGGGLLPKAAVAYAGTRVAGLSLERLYRIGYGYTLEERRAAYGDALERGKQIASGLLNSIRGRRAITS